MIKTETFRLQPLLSSVCCGLSLQCKFFGLLRQFQCFTTTTTTI